ncbi:MAG: ABC transporter ATP-binding protein [Deltaproteobacteria bacterium]|nr:ABC transporter ATP-binding protein [Deltaproteobacteria bacterium]
MTVALSIQQLEKTIRVGFFAKKVTLLRGISIDVQEGSIFGFVGQNGAGKSTTIKHLIGALQPTNGKVEIFGHSPRERSTRARFGYLPEFPRLPDTLSPRELLLLHGRLAGLSTEQARKKGNELLEKVLLADRGDEWVRGFSKGMQQKVALCLTLIGEPELLILDEPMSGLDPVGRRMVRDIIREQHQMGRTVFFSSHVLPDVEDLCDEVAIISAGKVVGQGSLQSFLDDKGRQMEVVFRLAPDTEALESWADWGKITPHGDRVSLLVNANVDALDVAQKLKAAGAEILDVLTLRGSLEDHLVQVIEAHQAEQLAEQAEAATQKDAS